MYISSIIKKSWEETKKNFWFFALVILIYTGLIIFTSMIARKTGPLGQILYIVLNFWLSAGWIIIALKIAQNHKASINDLFRGFPYLASYTGASILYFLMVSFGAILLLVPGIIWGIKFVFYPYFTVHKQMKALEALKASSDLTNGIKWDLLGFFFVTNIIGVLGLLALIIGIFWAWPLTMIAQALLYLKIIKTKSKIKLE